MFIRQISVYVENIRGSLRDVTRVLSEADIDVMALSVADTASFGIVRLIVRDKDNDKALAALKENGNTARKNHVICVGVPNKPGSLDKILKLVDESDISIEYLYAFNYSTKDNEALINFRMSDQEAGAKLLSDNGIKMYSQEEIDAL
ncbi:MAG: ACT domain-containing protein [Eubacterium sp.]